MAEFGRVDILVNNAGVGTAVPGHARDARAVPRGHRRQPQRLLLDGAGLRAGDAARQLDREHLQRPRAHHRRACRRRRTRRARPALIGLTRDLAQQWTGRKGIRVNALAPGFFESEMTDDVPAGYLEEHVLPRTLVGRLGRAEELAAALVFLVSDAGGYVTGTTLTVDGGMLTT